MTTLSFTDNANGTGGVFTVADSPGGDTDIYVSQFAGTMAGRAWVNAGSVSGNGTFNYATALTGGFTAFAIDSANVPTTPFGFRVTSGVLPLHLQVMNAVREYVIALSLPGVSDDPDNHRVVKLPYRPDLELNLETATRDVCVFYFPVAETYTPHTNETDTVAFPVNVLFLRQLGKELEVGLKGMLNIRQFASQSMSRCPIADVEEIHTVDIQPGSVFLPEQWAKKLDASNIVFRCLGELPAGLL